MLFQYVSITLYNIGLIPECVLRYPFIVDLFASVWNSGGGDTPKIRSFKLARDCQQFKVKFEDIQAQLQDLCGMDDLLTGVLSKSKGQILRLAAVFNALFSHDPKHPLNDTLSVDSVKAAINFIETCNEHTTIIGGRKTITEPLSCKSVATP